MKKARLVAASAAAAVAATVAFVAPAAHAAKTVTIMGGFSGTFASNFQKDLDAWSAKSGIKVKFVTLASFDTDITTKIKAGQAPDIAVWPQPGGLLEQSSKLVSLDAVLGADLRQIKSTLVPGWDQLAVKGGKLYGLPINANVKSLIFYNPAAFKTAGLTVPKTQADIDAVTATIKSKGLGYPWCAGIESGGATGWPATDWMEEYALKLLGPKKYNTWWQGTTHWSDPTIQKAGQIVADTLLADGQVQGGGKAIAARGFGEASTAGLFASGKAAGQCFFLKQGSFIVGFMPKAIQAEVAANDFTHVGVIAVPTPAVKGASSAVLGGGDIAAVFNKSSETKAVARFIMSDQLGRNGFAQEPQWISPHKTFPSNLYLGTLHQQFATFLSTASGFGFDGSDLAPAAVNKAEWTELTNWFAGTSTMKQAFDKIDAAYNA